MNLQASREARSWTRPISQHCSLSPRTPPTPDLPGARGSQGLHVQAPLVFPPRPPPSANHPKHPLPVGTCTGRPGGPSTLTQLFRPAVSV